MKEYDIIAEGGYTTTRIPETTLINDCRRERVIPPLVAMIFPTSKRSGIQRTVTRRMSKLAPIPMPGGNDLSALREIVFLNLIIAIISDTYGDIQDKSQENGLFEQANVILDMIWLLDIRQLTKG